MPDFTTETGIFVGQTGTGIFGGYAGFRMGQQYPLSHERRGDGTVGIVASSPKP